MSTPFSAVNIGVRAIAVHDAFMPAADVVSSIGPLVLAFAVIFARDKGSGIARARRVREGSLATQNVLFTREGRQRVSGVMRYARTSEVSNGSSFTTWKSPCSMISYYVRDFRGMLFSSVMCYVHVPTRRRTSTLLRCICLDRA